MGFTPEQREAYNAARELCAWRERSDLGSIEATGADRYTWLQGMLSQDVRLLEQGAAAVYAYFLNATGHILAELKIVRVEAEKPSLLLVTARENVGRLMEQLDRFLIMEDVELRDVSDEIVCLELYGREIATLEALSKNGTLIATDGGAEWYGSVGTAMALRQELHTLPQIDSAVAEALRIEAGTPRYPNELNESVIALEANNAATHISFTKGCYVGQEIIARIDSRGHTNRALTGFIAEDGATLAVGDRLFTVGDEREIGRLTSVLEESPLLGGKAIAIGYLRHEYCCAGEIALVKGEGREALASVSDLPFTEALC